MKTNKYKERRQINIPKSDYDYIKRYCESNGLNMPKWIVLQIKQIIQNKQ